VKRPGRSPSSLSRVGNAIGFPLHPPSRLAKTTKAPSLQRRSPAIALHCRSMGLKPEPATAHDDDDRMIACERAGKCFVPRSEEYFQAERVDVLNRGDTVGASPVAVEDQFIVLRNVNREGGQPDRPKFFLITKFGIEEIG
jgi:hypothetical protein